ncbi:MAG: AraC family transcriptional regulator [Bacteroidota bacterium]
MKLYIEIEGDIYKQFSEQLNVKETHNSLSLDPRIGEGKINCFNFPNSVRFYHFKFKLNQSIELNSFNSRESEYFLLNINLSEKEVKKNVNGEEINFQKYLPSGILLYPPNIKVVSESPTKTNFEIVLIKFHRELLDIYFENNETIFRNIAGTIIYEDLDVQSEQLLQEIILGDSKLKSHANLLAFLSIFFDKFNSREEDIKYENLHPQDVKQLFLAASFLRDPTPKYIPTIEELAKIANMGKTKFKNVFKQVFGKPPKQYHQKIRMEYAKEILIKKKMSSSEIAYELGYADPSKFTRAFKNHFGETPSSVS